ncbi:MAG TPA: 2-oxo-4-hydroxy-4-carboxy-5-ureidoimidazoline decarboxylase [Candidatus Eisenbacteria bacterium]|nr:2-oxo-4-hydroxy-4-carboxy-5-ureidoimidazoline decarboxylase [Candidatus Eisenbacteria bacterium]
MRSDPRDYQLVTPGTLLSVLSLMDREPESWTPIAGGTDLMVLYAAGKLPGRRLVSIWNLPELREIEVLPEEVRIGAGCTYSDLRQNEIIAREFPLLSSAAAWTGGVANQNRGTLGGNIVNASPAADSLPALLVYEAVLALVSARGEREVPYTQFHHGYKKHALQSGELIRAVKLPRNYANYFVFTRKVGSRKAQAISKVCVAALGKIENGTIVDARIALGSVAPTPLRLNATEDLINGQKVEPGLASLAAASVARYIQPIDDIRSTTKYRAAVAANLVGEFVETLCSKAKTTGGRPTNDVLRKWNEVSSMEGAKEILSCCGSTAWAERLAQRRPFADESSLLTASEEIWSSLTPNDWLEAFRNHPRLGESPDDTPTSARSAAWSQQEQARVNTADDDVKCALTAANRAFEETFGHIFIVCATGKSAAEILAILRRRMQNDKHTELREAADEQRQITQLRLKKWLGI